MSKQETFRILYVNVIENNAGWGAECFVNCGFQVSGHDVHNIDYRKHRNVLGQKFLEVADQQFDFLLLQRGDYFPLDLLATFRKPILFWASELVARQRDQDLIFSSGLCHHAFVRTPICKDTIVRKGWMKANNISILLSGFDGNTHRQCNNTKKDVEVLFVGSLTERRQAILDELTDIFDLKIVSAFGNEMVDYVNHAKVILNIHAAEELDTETRVYEVLGAGGLLITEKLSSENPFIPNRHFIETESVSEMVDKIRYHLHHREQSEKIAQAGMREAHLHHTYAKRAEHIVEVFQRYRQSQESTQRSSLSKQKIYRYIIKSYVRRVINKFF